MYREGERERYNQELIQASAARASGNEARARVCARRAAGIAAGAYLRERGIDTNTANAIDRINRLAAMPGLPEAIYPMLNHLLTRVDTEFALPLDIDLIDDVKKMAIILQNLIINNLETNND